MRFIAIARVSCASGERAPRLIAPVENRLTISWVGSTSSRGTGGLSLRIRRSPRISPCWAFSSLTRSAKAA